MPHETDRQFVDAYRLGRTVSRIHCSTMTETYRIAVYDITGDRKYLQTAQLIFDDMDKAYGTTPCGGLWWDKAHTYVNAIANGLYIDVAAHLANRASQYRSGYYLDKATTAWKGF